jgi:ATP-dependent Lon protease
LFPRQLKTWFNDWNLTIGKKQLEKIVEGYTRRSGVRGLEAKLSHP